MTSFLDKRIQSRTNRSIDPLLVSLLNCSKDREDVESGPLCLIIKKDLSLVTRFSFENSPCRQHEIVVSYPLSDSVVPRTLSHSSFIE